MKAEMNSNGFNSLLLLFTLMPVVLFGCAGHLAEELAQPYSPTKHRTIRIQSCLDRSNFRGHLDLVAEATQALTQKILATKLFEVVREPALLLTCDVAGSPDRSAFQSGFPPLWGTTEVRMTVVVWEKPDDRIIATFRSFVSAPSGGLNTIGTDRYLVNGAVDDIVRQLQMWVKAGSGKRGQ
jgi:hypothetical protein